MKKLISTFLFFWAVFALSAQDLIYTVSAEIEEQKTSLDSILVENLSNDTRILFSDLPALEYYQINLTKNAFWGTVGTSETEMKPEFVQTRNLPGLIQLTWRGISTVEARLSIFNINGQLVYAAGRKTLFPNNSIRVQLTATGMYFVQIQSPLGTKTFKAIGSEKQTDYGVKITVETSSGVKIKSSFMAANSDFSFMDGDSIRISVYKEDYYAPPSSHRITTSKYLNFEFRVSSAPVVTTLPPTDVTQTTATINGEVTSDGGAAITERGFYWSETNTNPGPTTGGTKVTVSGTTGNFNRNLSGLKSKTTYYYRAFATNAQGISTGIVLSFTTNKEQGGETGTLTDSRDNKTYNTVKIGDQVWMAENLAYLPAVNPASSGSRTGKHYYVSGYNGTDVNAANATDNYKTYGVLYNWPAALTACPSGWHLPSDSEWTQLENYLSDNGYNYDGTIGGGSKKFAKSMAATTLWNTSSATGAIGNNLSANNSSGFSGLPGGGRSGSGNFDHVGDFGYWWSAAKGSISYAWNRYLYYGSSTMYRYGGSKEYGFSVRCVRD